MIGNIEILRKEKGINQEEIASHLGITRQTYSKIEKGSIEPSLGQAVKLAGLFDVDIAEFLGQDVGVKKTANTDEDKYKQIIQFFIENGNFRKGITKTKLAKLCYLADFSWYYNNLESLTNLQYKRIQQGPVPDDFFRVIDELENEESISLVLDGKAHIYSNISFVKTDKLTLEEKSLLSRIAKKWKKSNTQEIVDFTHKQLPWMMCDEKELIPYHLITQEDPNNVY